MRHCDSVAQVKAGTVAAFVIALPIVRKTSVQTSDNIEMEKYTPGLMLIMVAEHGLGRSFSESRTGDIQIADRTPSSTGPSMMMVHSRCWELDVHEG